VHARARGRRPTSRRRSRPTASACARTCCAASGCARAGRHDEAIDAWKAIERQDPQYFGLVAEGMLESYKALGRLGEGLTLLRGLQHRYPGSTC
jgi:pentatricopeptide repeat protein